MPGRHGGHASVSTYMRPSSVFIEYACSPRPSVSSVSNVGGGPLTKLESASVVVRNSSRHGTRTACWMLSCGVRRLAAGVRGEKGRRGGTIMRQPRMECAVNAVL